MLEWPFYLLRQITGLGENGRVHSVFNNAIILKMGPVHLQEMICPLTSPAVIFVAETPLMVLKNPGQLLQTPSVC